MRVPSCEIQEWAVWIRVPSLGYLVLLTMEGKLPVLTQGDGVNLCAWVDLHGHGSCASFSWQHQVGIEGDLSIRGSLGQQGAFLQVSRGLKAVSC